MFQISSIGSTFLFFFLASETICLPEGIIAQQQTLQDCLASKNVPTTLNSSSDWSSLIAPFNLRLQYTPTAVALPTTPEHVSDSVTCAVSAGVKVQPRSGGHSFGSFGIGGKDGSLVVDLQGFNEVSLDSSTGIVTAGGGVRLGNLGVGIFNQGQRALPHGTCPGVGIGGHYTHGGFGYSSRRWGYALDAIIAMDVILANGSYIHTTPTSYPDIYYALRGAADSFGIVTTFYLQTQPAPSQIVSYSITFDSALKSVDTSVDIFLKLQNFVTTSPYMDRNTSLEISLGFTGEFSIRGWHFGDLEYFSQTVFPAMLEGMPTPDNSTIQYRSWLEGLEDIADGEPLIQPLTGYDTHQTFYSKSVVTREAHPLTRTAVESFFTYIINNGSSSKYPWITYIGLYGGRDSQVNIPSSQSSAYSHRDSLWVVQNLGSTPTLLPPFDPEIISFVKAFSTALTDAQPDGDFLGYPNYIDTELTREEAARLYYGEETWGKLVGIKEVVDPKGVFWNPQGVEKLETPLL